jgi:hypothetical protein
LSDKSVKNHIEHIEFFSPTGFFNLDFAAIFLLNPKQKVYPCATSRGLVHDKSTIRHAMKLEDGHGNRDVGGRWS